MAALSAQHNKALAQARSSCSSVVPPRRPARLVSLRASGTGDAQSSLSSPSTSQGGARPAGVSVGGYSPTSPQGWQRVKETLLNANVKMLSAQEVIFAQERGVPIIDVRPPADFKAARIPGAKSAPYYQPIEGWEPMKVARRMGFALFGVLNGTEVNPNFTSQASALVDPKLGAILVCAIGGTLEASDQSKRGTQSRSLIAAWQLVESGCTNISVMKGGFNEWVKSGREVEADE